ncbi:acyl CoA:acetate/3-ketoacid CoA transferase [Clostridiisalibacter paucivorans]|uniref:acyl CoA:acetate/3-ketoacid CoA transferase n=1 Tax=Clostridiisalibacter paucivorans TaxID=408753 RepID=UPI00047DAAA9|nr:CoA-transferase [Clostridiisalibacter paucivorans]
MSNKIINTRDAINLIKDGQTLAIGGFVGFTIPEELLVGLKEKYLETQSPKNLNVFYCAGIGDGKERGLNHLALDGLISKLYCGHLGLAPKLGALVAQNKFPAYTVPQGVTVHLLRAIAGGKPGVLTHVGLKTFADPRIEGCCANELAKKEPINQIVNIDGNDWILYKSFPIDVCFIKATTADTHGNLTLENEALFADQLSMAEATKNSGGIVIAQVERITEYGSLNAQNVRVHSHLVDHIVVGKDENNVQSFLFDKFIPEWTGQIRRPLDSLEKMPLNPRKVCGRRGLFELENDMLVNLGIGVPEAVAAAASEEGIADKFTLTIESGVMGGVPASGLGIGATYNPDAIHEQGFIFDLYDGGGIDIACLGAAEIDKKGNVNVSKFGGRVVGPGGFVNITQNSKKVIFCGTFTAKGLKTEVKDGSLKITTEGSSKKFKEEVEQISFSADYANESGQEVLYLTERAVFRLTSEGIELIEIAPGVDLQKDILDQMEFKPLISENLKEMDTKIFTDEPMGISL